MILNRENIHENKIKCSNTIQITLDDDYNVPDSKADIDAIVKEYGVIVQDNLKVSGERAEISGKLEFAILYIGGRQSDGRHMPVKMTGEMPFHENVNLSQNSEGAYCSCTAKIDDISVKAINSRKISVRAIISLTVTCEVIEDITAAIGMEEDDEDRKFKVQVLNNKINYTQSALNMCDNLRIKAGITLPADKPEVGEVLWQDVEVRNMNTRLTDSGVTISGELSIFIMYLPQDESMSVQWYDTTDTFEENLDISGSNPDLIGYIRYNVINTNVDVKPDYDGENRDVSVEIVMNMDIKAYEECEEQFISDMYSPICSMNITTEKEIFHQLLIHNNSKCRASGQHKMEDYSKILQICNCTGTVQIDNIDVQEDGLVVDGAILANVFYVTEDDNSPMGSIRAAIPFTDKVMVRIEPGQLQDVDYQVITGIDQLTASMTGGGQIEIKGTASVDALCFVKKEINVIKDCEMDTSNDSDYLKLPTMIGFISDGKMRLWDIAKKYHTTTESIRQGNQENSSSVVMLSDGDLVRRGEKLLLVKSPKDR